MQASQSIVRDLYVSDLVAAWNNRLEMASYVSNRHRSLLVQELVLVRVDLLSLIRSTGFNVRYQTWAGVWDQTNFRCHSSQTRIKIGIDTATVILKLRSSLS